ncbi:adhesion G protein-coupled receptor E5 isoform X2 [Trichosurus vulpecula]|uniref:adhesion G protein-coupled receptor E5 isoform X2 n=1 Tax=Trichosurus vulpecula TaxID=9337 RepID=UPI00186B47AF|nr:adhesion G protein-coupled receptor E5 isoform X2 [Trichosurus vulpecula]
MPALPRGLLLGLCVLVLLETAFTQNPKDSRCRRRCPQHAACINETHCTCEDGFASSSGEIYFNDPLEICDDVNECVPPIHISCGAHADCVNTEGSYYCTCIPGYALPSGEKRFPNDTMNDCQNVNECAPPFNVSCGQNAECVDIHESYHCTCNPGYALPSGEKKFPNATMNDCQDVDECQRSPLICEPHGRCINQRGSYMCKCKSGFAKSNKNEIQDCIDINECAPSINISCGQNADCVNTEGSYHCTCKPGYVLPSGEKTFPNATMNNCQEISFPSWTPPSGVSQNFLNQLRFITSKLKYGSGQETVKEFVKDIENLLNTSADLEHLPLETRLQVATYLLSGSEQILRAIAQTMPNGPLVFPSPRGAELSLNIMEKPNGSVEVGRSHSKMRLNWNLAWKHGGSEKAVVGLFSTHDMKKLLASAPLVLEPETKVALQQVYEAPVREGIPVLLSAVSTAFLSNKDTGHLSSPVTFTFSHPNESCGPRQEVICAFWKHDNNGSGHWATTGCKKWRSGGTSTTCNCTHLSSFAILMAQYDVEDWTLSVITQVGLGVSLVCLLLCILTFLLCRSIQGSRTTIHLHLCLCLFVGSAVFLAGTANPGQGQVGLRCRLVAGLLHYCFLAAFCWMCLEGLELYFLVVRVFPGPGLRTRWLCLLGYGTPAFIVAISAAVNSQGYGRPRYCWLSLENGFIWSFLGPVTLIIAFNAIIFVITVWKLTQKFSEINPDMKKLKKARMLTFTAIAQLCILGCTWIFGLFLFGPQSHVLAYIFTILNCFQGCFLFLLHCLLNKKVREEYRRLSCIVTKSKYNEFSTSTTSQSRALRPSLESGM